MPDEEMDILADFGPDAFTEDIDIDLDLAAVVHPDEDLELADFDHSADLQLFNSDGRDELMAEGDDASYGMVDADDIDHTETITVTEDIDIDLVAPDNDVAWLGDATEASASFNDVHEIDFVDAGHNDEHAAEAYAALDSNDTSLTDNIELNTARSQSPQKAIGGILGEQHRPAVIGNDFNKPINAQLVAGNHEPLELSLDAPTGVTGLSQDLEAGQAALSSSLHGGTEIKDIVDTGAYDSTNAEVQESDDVLGETSLLENDEGNAQHELGEAIGQPDSSRQVLQESTSGKISPPPEDIATVATSPDEIRKPELDAHTSIQSPPPSERLEANEDFEGEHAVNSPRNTGNGLTEDVPNHEEQSHLLSDATDKAGNTDVTNQPTEEGTQLQSDNVADREDLIARHRPVISYKRTDYRLLAESEHDDPDTYFLKDSSHLESSLDYFLSALRQVVSGEVSPLDELVLYVDGLGLEFAESSSPTLLAEHTYTELLLLYDQLTLNDGAESVPPFFCYLSVRPCGAQRLSALKESAKAGHGLSQVAVYREFTPEEDLEEVESHSNVDANSNAGDCEDETLDIEHSDHSTEHIHGNEQGSKDSKEEQENAAHDSSPQQVDPEGQIDVVGRDGVNPEAEDGFYDEFNLSTATHDDVNAPLINNEHNAVSEDASAAESGSIEEPSVDTSNEDVDAVVSADTSATVTANGDDNDEIGYSDDEDEAAAAGTTNSDVSADSKTPILPDVPPDDDEITWESDHEELSVDDKPSTVQVSPVAGKRARSDSISLAETSGQNDVKRQRS